MRFYFVDKITEFEKGSSISGIKNISMTEPFFTFHFQRYPVMPGVLIIESLAQLAGLMIEMSFEKGCYKKAILSIIDKTKIKFMARPGDQLIMNAVLESISENGAACAVSAFIGRKLLCQTRLTFALMDTEGLYDKYLEDERQALINALMRDFKGGGEKL